MRYVSMSICADRISEKGDEFMILAAVALPDGNYMIISRRSHVRRKLQIYRGSFINFAAALKFPRAHFLIRKRLWRRSIRPVILLLSAYLDAVQLFPLIETMLS